MKDRNQVSQLAKQLLNDEFLLRRLTDRVYELMQEEMQNQCDRWGGWKR